MLMDVNYFGALYATKAVLEQMKFFKSGTITFISSQGGQTGFIGMSAYSPTKFALKGLAECLRSEVGISTISTYQHNQRIFYMLRYNLY